VLYCYQAQTLEHIPHTKQHTKVELTIVKKNTLQDYIAMQAQTLEHLPHTKQHTKLEFTIVKKNFTGLYCYAGSNFGA
jgi:hypothetical protein